MSECLVGLGHAVHLLLALEGGTLLVVGVYDLSGEFVSHGFAGALAGIEDKVFHGNRNLALRTNLHGNLERCATDTLLFHFDLGRDVLQGLFPDFQRRFISILHLLADDFQRVVENRVGNTLLTIQHKVVHETGHGHVSELRIRK